MSKKANKPSGTSTGSARSGLPRVARLKRRRLIQALFDRSRGDVHTLARSCIRLVYRLASPEEVLVYTPVQVGFSPGRGFRSAVQRNRIKRYLREVYRHHQHLITEPLAQHPGTLTLMVMYRGSVADAEACIRRILPRLLHQVYPELRRTTFQSE